MDIKLFGYFNFYIFMDMDIANLEHSNGII